MRSWRALGREKRRVGVAQVVEFKYSIDELVIDAATGRAGKVIQLVYSAIGPQYMVDEGVEVVFLSQAQIKPAPKTATPEPAVASSEGSGENLMRDIDDGKGAQESNS